LYLRLLTPSALIGLKLTQALLPRKRSANRPAQAAAWVVAGAQFGDAAATRVVEVHKRKAGPGHRILQERDRRRPRQAMLAAEMQKSADKAMASVSVIITAARPVAVVGKMLE
jgi:hypothetical protein